MRSGASYLPSLAGVAYAVTDEVHQHFIEGRHASAIDVALDAFGVALGIFAANRLFKSRPGDRPPDMAASDISLHSENSPERDMATSARSEGQSLGHDS